MSLIPARMIINRRQTPFKPIISPETKNQVPR